MRRAYTIVACTLILQGVLSSHAYGWWDEVEKLSGPGPFYGWDVEVRLFCLVETHTRDNNGRIVQTTTEKVSPTAIGAVVSACRVKKGSVRRMAVDLGARFLWAKDNQDFANGERINLTTLEPSVSFNLFSKHPDRDFVDVGFGAGAYWFSSTEFPSFNGAFLEPIRFEFHVSTNMKQQHRWAAAVPRVRVGYLLFPAGFETASFAAAPEIPTRISRDWVFNVALFFDLEGLFQ